MMHFMFNVFNFMVIDGFVLNLQDVSSFLFFDD